MTLPQIEAYALTLLVEAVAAFLLGPRFGADPRRAALAAIIGSALSHPVFWPSAIALYPKLGGLTIPLLEAAVVFFESIAYRVLATKFWRIALILSALVNFASWLTGVLVFALQ